MLNVIKSIELDLTPYDVAINSKKITILECGGSILAELDTCRSNDNNRFAEEFKYAEIGSEWWQVSYDHDDRSCSFIPTGRIGGVKQGDFEEILDWISDNYDAIQSIGYEVLEIE